MKLTHLADYGGPYAGSFVPMLRSIMSAARERGWEVESVFSEVAHGRPWLSELEADGIPYRFLPTNTRGEAHDAVAELVAAGRGDSILHSHFSSFDLACAYQARHNKQTLTFWHVHSPLKRGGKAWARNSVRFRVLSRGVTEILCVSPDIARGVLRRFGPRRRVVFFPNAIDTARFAPLGPEARLAARKRLDLPDGATVLLHFGWDWLRKGGDLYLRAIRRLIEDDRERNLIAVTVGGGERAQELVEALGLSQVVRVLASTTDVAELYATADLFVSPSRAEGMPFSIAEALATGTPVVASPLPGQRYFSDRATACRLAPLEAEALADAIRAQLGRDEASKAADREAARRWLVHDLDVRAWAARLLDHYRAALEAPR